MKIEIQLTPERIVRDEPPPQMEMGALAEFAGIVRGEENGFQIAALEYEAYSPMAERVMRGIIEDIGQRHPCLSVHATHRLGVIPVGDTAIHLAVVSRHRAEAFAMLAEFMNRLKQDVPIWKRRALNHAELEALKTS